MSLESGPDTLEKMIFGRVDFSFHLQDFRLYQGESIKTDNKSDQQGRLWDLHTARQTGQTLRLAPKTAGRCAFGCLILTNPPLFSSLSIN
jgi:hypothetical protein